MNAIDMEELKIESTVGVRSKGSSIFYSCTVLSVNGDKVVLSNPNFRDQTIVASRKIELRILKKSGDLGLNLYVGTVSEMFVDSMEVRISSTQKYEEKRKSIRVPCEIKLKYMDQKDTEEIWYTTYSINMSPGGIKMYSSRFHKEGDILIFQFNISSGHASRSLLIRGRVARIKKVSDIKFENQYSPKSQGYRKYIANISFEGMSARDNMDMTRFIYINSKNK